jgi:hypothetical protein
MTVIFQVEIFQAEIVPAELKFFNPDSLEIFETERL